MIESTEADQVAGATSDAVGHPAFEVDHLTVQFATDHGWVTVVDDVSFAVNRGEVLGLVGESGSGKSVTNLAAIGLLPRHGARISRGSARLNGRELVGMAKRELEDLRGDRIAMIFQEPMTSLNPAFTVGDQIGEVLRRHRGLGRESAQVAAAQALDRVGIPNAARRVHSYPHEFSGGMRQRVMIAMSIVCEPTVLIADEPTTALDVTIQAQILDLLREMRSDLGMAMIFITHNMGVVAEICDRVAVMYAGQIVERATVSELFAIPGHPYTEGLLRSMPQLIERSGRLSAIPGTTPPPWNLPTGCRFMPRCPYAEPECSQPLDLVESARHHSGHEVRCCQSDVLVLRGGQ
jgi:peptide/nickel transport system ATP-binding protein